MGVKAKSPLPAPYTGIQFFPDLSKFPLQLRRQMNPITKSLQNHKVPYKWRYPATIIIVRNGQSHSIVNLDRGLKLLQSWGIIPEPPPTAPPSRGPKSPQGDTNRNYTWTAHVYQFKGRTTILQLPWALTPCEPLFSLSRVTNFLNPTTEASRCYAPPLYPLHFLFFFGCSYRISVSTTIQAVNELPNPTHWAVIFDFILLFLFLFIISNVLLYLQSFGHFTSR